VQAKITKSSPSATWKTLVSGSVKLSHKFERGQPKRGCQMRRGWENLQFQANTTERDRSCCLAPSGECKRNTIDTLPIRLHKTGRMAPSGECRRNTVARMGELRFGSHQAFKHASPLCIPLCVSWAFFLFNL